MSPTLFAFYSLLAIQLTPVGPTAGALTNTSNPSFSRIRDIIYEPEGQPFNGTISIEPQNFDHSKPPVVVVPVNDGMLSVTLVPTSPMSLASYVATYSARDSQTRWVETWHVPRGDRLSLKDVRASQSAISSPAIVGRKDADSDRDVTLPLPIADVIQLSATLNSINSSLASIANAANAMNTIVGPRANTQFVRAEVPSGVLDGTNVTFALANLPLNNNVSISLNGLRLRAEVDYSVSGSTLTFVTSAVPRSGDVLRADYEFVTSASSSSRYFDPRSITLPIPITGISGLPNALNQINTSVSLLSRELVSLNGAVAAITCLKLTVGETPQGLLDGANATFTVTNSAAIGPTISLYDNGLRLTQGVDYALGQSSIQFLTVAVPQPGDLLSVDYCSPQ